MCASYYHHLAQSMVLNCCLLKHLLGSKLCGHLLQGRCLSIVLVNTSSFQLFLQGGHLQAAGCLQDEKLAGCSGQGTTGRYMQIHQVNGCWGCFDVEIRTHGNDSYAWSNLMDWLRLFTADWCIFLQQTMTQECSHSLSVGCKHS